MCDKYAKYMRYIYHTICDIFICNMELQIAVQVVLKEANIKQTKTPFKLN